MITLNLFRNSLTKESALGTLSIAEGDKEEFICYTLEDCVREVPNGPVKNWKIPGQTAIPRGRYRVLKTMSQRFKRYTLHIMDVPGFAGIRIHAGNTAGDTEGCVLVGTGIADRSINGSQAITSSRDAVAKLEARLFPLLDDYQPIFIVVR